MTRHRPYLIRPATQSYLIVIPAKSTVQLIQIVVRDQTRRHVTGLHKQKMVGTRRVTTPGSEACRTMHEVSRVKKVSLSLLLVTTTDTPIVIAVCVICPMNRISKDA